MGGAPLSVTVEDLKAYLDEMGYTLPDSMLTCLLAKADAARACMIGAGYSVCDQDLAVIYLAAMLSVSSGARRIKSQAAPSGASRSFDYAGDQLRQLRQALAIIDQSGCTVPLQPADPNARAALFIGRPSCHR